MTDNDAVDDLPAEDALIERRRERGHDPVSDQLKQGRCFTNTPCIYNARRGGGEAIAVSTTTERKDERRRRTNRGAEM